MFNFIKNKNKNKGFTLIEILVALSILILLGLLTLSTIEVIPQTRMRQTAQTFKSEFELARSFAKTHGGDAGFSVTYTSDGYKITRTSNTVIDNETVFDEKKLAIFYKVTGDNKEYRLGFDDASDVKDKTLTMTFSQSEGSIIGPHLLDYIILSNGSKSYKFIIQQKSGMMYYDYEVDGLLLNENVVDDSVLIIKKPSFIVNGNEYESYGPDHYLELNHTGETLQPEISYDSKHIRISGAYRAINKNEDGETYEIVFTLKDIYTTKWEDGTTDPKTLVWKIQ